MTMKIPTISRAEYQAVANILKRQDAEHLIGVYPAIGAINQPHLQDYFTHLVEATQILIEHSGNNEHIKCFIQSLTAVNKALYTIVSVAHQLSDLEQFLYDLEYADCYYCSSQASEK